MKKHVLIIARKHSKQEKKSILKEVLSVAPIVVFFLALVVVTYKYTNAFEIWERILFGDPTEKYIEQAETDRISLLSQVELNKKELSREVRLDLLIETNQLNKIFKKYLSPEEYNLYLWCQYSSQFRKRTRDEILTLFYLHEKVMKEMTAEEKETVNKALKILKRIKSELKEIQARKQENKQSGKDRK